MILSIILMMATPLAAGLESGSAVFFRTKEGGVTVHRAKSKSEEVLVSRLEGGVNVHRVTTTAESTDIVSPSLEGLPKVLSNVSRDVEVLTGGTIPRSAAPDVLGAFRFICQAGQINWDDAIVYPGAVGASPHLHQWFGNSLANGKSTYQSLRTSGESTCMGPMNRSAYWQPAMMNGKGQVIRPDYISIYYKRLPKTNPRCAGGLCLALPRGLRYIFGYDMKRMGSPQPENQHFTWKCIMSDWGQRGEKQNKIEGLPCIVGDSVMVNIASPDCWNGKNLDSLNHQSHMAYQAYDQNTGQPSCPTTHPYLLPQFTIGASFSVAAGDDISTWHLASDRMPGMADMTPGSTFHADWFGAWDDDVLKIWTDNCIDKMLNCSDGELGDGSILKRPAGFGLTANPRLVNAPVKPVVQPPVTAPPVEIIPIIVRKRQVRPTSIRVTLPADMPKTQSSGAISTLRSDDPQELKPKISRQTRTGGVHEH